MSEMIKYGGIKKQFRRKLARFHFEKMRSVLVE